MGIVTTFRDRTILVVGDIVLDEYVIGHCDRVSPEAPVVVIRVTESRSALGGAGNTAANVTALGGRAILVFGLLLAGTALVVIPIVPSVFGLLPRIQGARPPLPAESGHQRPK